MKFDRFDFTVWGLLTFFGLALAAIILGSSLIGPRVAHTFPANGGEVDASGRIGLEFAEPMQARTVEPQFEIEPPTLGKLQWEGQRLWFAPDRPFQPGLSYTARLKAGALSEQGRSRKLDVIWSFRARTPWIVYLSPVNPPHQLWRIPSTGGNAQPLTSASVNVQDFAVSLNGQHIVYSQTNPQRGSDLWLMTGEGKAPHLLVDCGVNLCARPVWSPDGARIAYNWDPWGQGLLFLRFEPNKPYFRPEIVVWSMAIGKTKVLAQDTIMPAWQP